MDKPLTTRNKVGIRQLFNLPHRLKGDGLSAKEKEVFQQTHADDRAKAEYLMRAGKVAFAIEQFIKRHDSKQVLLGSPFVRSICNRNGQSHFTTYEYPKEFLPVISSILNAPSDGAGICGWASSGDVNLVSVKLEAAFLAGSIPDRPFIRLAMFGRREEVIVFGKRAKLLSHSVDLEVPQAAALLLFAFKHTAGQEMRLAQLLYNTSAYCEDKALWAAAENYLKSIKEGKLPFF